jgi:hypothetical protein
MSAGDATPAQPTLASVEAVVRQQLSTALGGRRGMVEAAVPTILFTVAWLTTKELRTALMVSIAAAVVLLAVRLVQRSSVQYVVNALVGIGIGALFVTISARGGASEEEQALAYFLPTVLYNAGYAVLMGASCVLRWPLVGFMVGSVTGEPTAWRQDPQVVRLCTRLTWLLTLPCVLRVVVQGPIWLSGTSGSLDPDTAVAILGVLKVAMGWPLQLLVITTMVWLLGRDRTPVEPEPASTR